MCLLLDTLSRFSSASTAPRFTALSLHLPPPPRLAASSAAINLRCLRIACHYASRAVAFVFLIVNTFFR